MDQQKRIGLITFHFPLNYGALLQTFALFEYIRDQGHDVEIINYCPPHHLKKYQFYQRPRSIRNTVYYIIKSWFLFSFWKKKAHFIEFRNQHLKETKPFSKTDEIVYDYDIVLTGSDQVFNFNHDSRLPYFQPFKKAKTQRKAAYAPSFGQNIFDDELENKIKRYIVDFDFLSCREELGTRFLNTLSTKTVKHVVDPVFLLSKTKWLTYTSNRLVEEDYIFVYDLNGKKTLIDMARKVKSKDDKIVLLSNDPVAKFKQDYRHVDVFIQSASVSDFLSLIHFSKGVITDSFHGVSFALIYNKAFLTFIALETVGSRIKSLLERINRPDALVSKEEISKGHLSLIRYENNIHLEQWIVESKRFLHSIWDD